MTGTHFTIPMELGEKFREVCEGNGDDISTKSTEILVEGMIDYLESTWEYTDREWVYFLQDIGEEHRLSGGPL